MTSEFLPVVRFVTVDWYYYFFTYETFFGVITFFI
jgi:hypothetical protein